MIGLLTEGLRREGRRSARLVLAWCLTGAWLSVAAYLWLTQLRPPRWAALAVAGLLVFGFLAWSGVQAGLAWLRRPKPPEPAPPLSDELLAQLEAWAADKPWLAVGLSAGLGFAAARNDRDLRQWLERLPDLLAGAEAAMKAGQGQADRTGG